jgi:hypothetical protein
MKKVSSLALIAVICSLPVVVSATQPVDAITEFQDAALNYETAADAQVALADNLLQARLTDTRKQDNEETVRRRRNRNASLDLQAIEQLVAAAGNLDHAARVWLSASHATREPTAKKHFQQSSRNATQRGTALMRQAADMAENAALEFAATGDLQNKAQASHRAGNIRELIAVRR